MDCASNSTSRTGHVTPHYRATSSRCLWFGNWSVYRCCSAFLRIAFLALGFIWVLSWLFPFEIWAEHEQSPSPSRWMGTVKICLYNGRLGFSYFALHGVSKDSSKVLFPAGDPLNSGWHRVEAVPAMMQGQVHRRDILGCHWDATSWDEKWTSGQTLTKSLGTVILPVGFLLAIVTCANALQWKFFKRWKN
jgi:hypothetical protein